MSEQIIDPFAWTDGVKWHKPAHRAVMANVVEPSQSARDGLFRCWWKHRKQWNFQIAEYFNRTYWWCPKCKERRLWM